jgi:hypothetical protein
MGGGCSGRLDGWAQSGGRCGRDEPRRAADVGGVSPGVQVPGRENGGNCDIKNLSRGWRPSDPTCGRSHYRPVPTYGQFPLAANPTYGRSHLRPNRIATDSHLRPCSCAVYFPVFVPGANLSMGDMHFSQGDGEVTAPLSAFLVPKSALLVPLSALLVPKSALLVPLSALLVPKSALLVPLSALLVPKSALLVPLSALLVPKSALLVPLSALLVPKSALLVPLSALLVPKSALLVPLSALLVPKSALLVPLSASLRHIHLSRSNAWRRKTIRRTHASCGNGATGQLLRRD